MVQRCTPERPRKDKILLISICMAEGLMFLARNKKGQFIAGEASEKRKAWTGNRYGKLVVIDTEYGVGAKKKRTICRCKCDCGNIVYVESSKLNSGRKTSCGCDTIEKKIAANRIDLTGKRFGKLTVLEMLWVKPHTKCRCICDCGNETIVINTGLTSGKTQSCGCYQRNRASESSTKDFAGVTAPSGVRFIERYKKHARGVWEWVCECPYCHERFYEIPARVLNGHVTSCGCVSRSAYEEYIEGILNKAGVLYKREYRFIDCKDTYPLPFDFAILNESGNVTHLIEYDGKQHYSPVEFFGGEVEFQKRVKHDKIKNAYCADNDIQLIRLPYTLSFDEIDKHIKSILNP